MATRQTPPRPRRSRKPASGRPPFEQAAARLDRILGIAADVFLEGGFQGVTMAEIARTAGASKETLYTRFPTKEDLFREAISRRTAILHEQFSRVLNQDEPIERVLEMCGANLLDFMLLPETQRLNRTLIACAPQFPELAEEFWRLCPEREHKELQAYLERQMSLGTLVILDPAKASEFFFSLCLGQFPSHASMLMREPPSASERKTHVWIAVQVFLAAYGQQRVLFTQHESVVSE
ncbi:MAG: TetR/AcrR family transcriptional regulator [Acidobacteriaceae bacterium]|nr:TetR/AcrR family transcriptional regulator [Acidobacteriaceae bacterium]